MDSLLFKANYVSEHPEFSIENAYLQNMVKALQDRLNKEEQELSKPEVHWSSSGAADEYSNHALKEFSINQTRKLRSILNEPYFGRFDFSSQDNKIESFYIGKTGFDHEGFNIINWKAQIAQLYYKNLNSHNNSVSYFSPDGTIKGKIWLKRKINIIERELQSIHDEFDYREGVDKQITPSLADNLFIQTLINRDTTKFQDIIQTIQEEQDFLIRKDPNTILVINGVAGSGKTSILYHRLAYLIFPETKSDIKPEKTLVLSPNKFFISYVQSLLPVLEIQNIQQETFENWAMYRMGMISKSKEGPLKQDYKLVDNSINIFLSPHNTKKQKIECWKRSKLKGGFKFRKFLDNYVKFKKNKNKNKITDWCFANLGDVKININYSKEEITNTFELIEHKNLPYNKFVEQIFHTLMQQFDEKYDHAVKKSYDFSINEAKNEDEIQKANSQRNKMYALPMRKQSVRKQVENQLRAKIHEIFQPITTQDYFQLLNDISIIKEIDNDFSQEEMQSLHTTPPEDNTYDMEDIPGMFYLFLLANGRKGEEYDHIVVDEAQDYSPLQFYILKRFNKKGSMSIAGDIAQGIFAHRGIDYWDELDQIFSEKNYEYFEVRKSYRSTRQIVEFTNEVKKQIGQTNVVFSEPYYRNGDLPIITRANSVDHILKQISRDILHLRELGVKDIGIIVKDPKDCDEIAWNINQISEYKASFINDENSSIMYPGGIVVLPVCLSKGIEFEAVMVLEADQKTYPGDTPYDGRLLYVALTRALHYLHIYCVGKPSDHLNTAIEKAKLIDLS